MCAIRNVYPKLLSNTKNFIVTDYEIGSVIFADEFNIGVRIHFTMKLVHLLP